MRAPDALEHRLRARLAQWESGGLRRSLRAPEPGLVDLSSNDYLNLAGHPAVVGRFADAALREGCGSTGSRLLRGERPAFQSIERRFAAFKRSERALYFSSGYLANLAVLTTFPEDSDTIFSDERNHASLIDGCRLSRARTLVFPHNDVEALASALSGAAGSGLLFVVVESLFSMDGDMAPLAEYAAVCRDAGAVLVVDEAHAVGVFGHRGTGLIEAAGIEDAVCVSVNTAGKALGVGGAFVAGPDWAIEYLVQRARPFVFSTASPPAMAEAIDASLTIVEREPERRRRLLERAAYARRRMAAAGMAVSAEGSQIIPVVIGNNEAAVTAAEALRRDGFDVRAIRPPSVAPGTARLRVAINVGVTEEALDRFVSCLQAVAREGGFCFAASL